MNINCLKCQYYYVTWDQNRPKGCKFHGFKSVKLPSIIVYEASGEKCLAFTEKRKK